MKDFLLQLFSQSSSVSHMRVMSMIVCLTGCKIALDHGDATVIGLLLTAAFTGKLVQKQIEVKNG